MKTKTNPKRRVMLRRPTAYDRGQHELICNALKVSEDPNAPGNTAYEAVCELMLKVDYALAAKTLADARKALKIKPGSIDFLPLYGQGPAGSVHRRLRTAPSDWQNFSTCKTVNEADAKP